MVDLSLGLGRYRWVFEYFIELESKNVFKNNDVVWKNIEVSLKGYLLVIWVLKGKWWLWLVEMC